MSSQISSKSQSLPVVHVSKPSALSSLHPLTNKTFSVFWTGAFLSSIGFWIQTVGQGWQVLQLTNSAFLLGLVTFAATLPNIVLSLFGGVISDRLNRRYLLIVTQSIYMTTAALLGILTTLHIITVWQIIILALINGTFSSIGFPAWQTFVGDLVPPEELKQGIALNSMQFNLSRVIGPAIGGLSVGLFGIAGSYYLNAFSYVAVIIPLLFIRPMQEQRRIEKEGIWSGLRVGLDYALKRPILLTMLFLQFLLAFFVFPYVTLLPIFAGNIFRVGATGLGVLNAAAGIGALLGSILIVLLSQRLEGKRGMYLLILLGIVGGAGSILFSLMPNVPTALPILLLLGACSVMSMTVTNTTIQSQTPIEMRGRVLSLWILVAFGLGPFGNLVMGWFAQNLGAPLTLALGGGLCVIGSFAVIVLRPLLARAN